MWVNVKRAETARGAFVGGQQMYVEYMIPAQVRHPFPVVLVHGGGGQGTDWLGTPDGRPGLVSVSRSGRLQGVRRRSSRARTIADSSRAARRIPGAGAHAREHRRTLHAAERESGQRAERVPEESQPVAGPGQRRLRRSRSPDGGHGWQLRRAAGACWQAVAARPVRRRGGGEGRAVAAVRRPAGPPPPANQQPAGRAQRPAPDVASGGRGTARQDRAGDHHDALGRWSVRAARRRSASEPREGDDHHRGRRRQRVRVRQPVGTVDDSGHLRSAGQRSGGDQDEVGRESRARRGRLLPAGGAGAQAAESEEHQGARRDGGLVVRVAGQSGRGRIPEAGGRAGRGAALGQARDHAATATR